MNRLVRWYARFDRAELAAALVLALIVLAAAAVPLGATLRYSPGDIESGRVVLTPPCPYRARTGRPCPLCGITRGISAMNRLRLGQAWAYNPWSVPIWVGLWLALGGGLMLAGVSGRRLASSAARSALPLTVRRPRRHRSRVTASRWARSGRAVGR